MRVTETAHWLEWQDWADPILREPFALQDGQLLIPTGRAGHRVGRGGGLALRRLIDRTRPRHPRPFAAADRRVPFCRSLPWIP
jgi:hypothetical protein